MLNEEALAQIEAVADVQAQAIEDGKIVPLTMPHVVTIRRLCAEVRRLRWIVDQETGNFTP